MAPTHRRIVSSTWEQYKEDINNLTTWLVHTAKICDPFSAVIDDLALRVPRLKGKARKLAKNSTVGPSTVTLIPTAKLNELASIIAQSTKPTIRVPKAIVRAGEQAIFSRKRFTDWFEKFAGNDPEVKRKNKTHGHFIGVLEQVMTTLIPHTPNSAETSSTSATQANHWSNKFEALDLEDCTEDSDELPEKYDASLDEQTTPTPLYELDISKDDVEGNTMFAIFCLFDDLLKLRVYLKELWEMYQDRSITLPAAAALTNTAFEAANKLENELRTDFPSIKSQEDMARGMYRYLLASPSLSDKECDDRLNLSPLLYEALCLSTHMTLSNYCRDLPKGSSGFLLYKPRPKDIYRPEMGRAIMSPYEKERENVQVLMEILPEYEFLALFVPKDLFLVKDELTQGLYQMMETSEIPMWLCFATQVYLDIHHTMRNDVGTALADLQALGAMLKGTVEEFLETPPTHQHAHSAELMSDKAMNALYIIEHTQKDVLGEWKQRMIDEFSLKDEKSPKMFRLLARQPILCRVLAFSLILNIREAGISLANDTGSILHTAHLYNAMKVNNPSTEKWDDIEQIISVHGPEKIFIGAAPTQPQAFYRQFALVIGMSAQNFAQARRQSNKTIMSQRPRKKLSISSPVAEIYNSRFTSEAKTELTIENVEAMIIDIWGKNEVLGANFIGRAMQREWLESKKVSLKDLMMFLFISVNTAMPAWTVNYFSIHQDCIAFLHAVKKALENDLGSPLSGENISYLPKEIFYLQIAQSLPENAPRGLGLPKGSHSALDIASNVLKEFLQSKGNPKQSDIYEILETERPGVSLAGIQVDLSDGPADEDASEGSDEEVEETGLVNIEADKAEWEDEEGKGDKDRDKERDDEDDGDLAVWEDATDLLRVLRRTLGGQWMLPRTLYENVMQTPNKDSVTEERLVEVGGPVKDGKCIESVEHLEAEHPAEAIRSAEVK